jgi:hypothetical protein
VNQPPETEPQTEIPSPRQPYETPVLEQHGTLQTITGSGGGGIGDI